MDHLSNGQGEVGEKYFVFHFVKLQRLSIRCALQGFFSQRPNVFFSKWFEPRSISSSCSVIVRVSVVLKRTVGDSD